MHFETKKLSNIDYTSPKIHTNLWNHKSRKNSSQKYIDLFNWSQRCNLKTVNCNIFIDSIDIQDYNSRINVIFKFENYLLWKSWMHSKMYNINPSLPQILVLNSRNLSLFSSPYVILGSFLVPNYPKRFCCNAQ